MKKIYKKPVIFFENFTLSTSIAGNCDRIINLPSQFACGFENENGVPGMTIFSPGPSSSCVIPGDGDEAMYDNFCYHIPTEGIQLFNS